MENGILHGSWTREYLIMHFVLTNVPVIFFGQQLIVGHAEPFCVCVIVLLMTFKFFPNLWRSTFSMCVQFCCDSRRTPRLRLRSARFSHLWYHS